MEPLKRVAAARQDSSPDQRQGGAAAAWLSSSGVEPAIQGHSAGARGGVPLLPRPDPVAGAAAGGGWASDGLGWTHNGLGELFFI